MQDAVQKLAFVEHRSVLHEVMQLFQVTSLNDQAPVYLLDDVT